MKLVLAVLALAAAEPPATAAPAAGPPVAVAPADDPASSLAGLQQMYDQSCAAREYGAYDDLCDQLSQQLKSARAQADREARRQAAEARRHSRAKAGAPRPQVPLTSTPSTSLPSANPATQEQQRQPSPG